MSSDINSLLFIKARYTLYTLTAIYIALQINGVRSTLISNQKGKRLMGADDLWYSTMRKPSLASSPFDWKLMLI
jgi:hypothetical protein